MVIFSEALDTLVNEKGSCNGTVVCSETWLVIGLLSEDKTRTRPDTSHPDTLQFLHRVCSARNVMEDRKFKTKRDMKRRDNDFG